MIVSRSRSRFVLVAAGLLLTLTALVGCSGAQADLQESAAGRLQSSVLEVTTAAAAGNYETARLALNALQAHVLTAAAAGQVTAARSAEIQSAINLVQADLTAAIVASTPTPTPTPTRTEEPDDEKHDEKGNGNDKGSCRKDNTCDEDDD